MPLGRYDALKLPADGRNKRVAIEVLIFVEVVADAHAQGVERRRLVGEACNQYRDQVGVKFDKILEQTKPVRSGAEVPIEDGQINGMLVREHEGRFRVGYGVDLDVKSRCREPVAERAA